MHTFISPAKTSDASLIALILREAALWLQENGIPLWKASDFTEETISPDTHLYHLIHAGQEVAGLFKLEELDELFWPDVDQTESLFIHKLVVRRPYAGTGLSSLATQYAVHEAEKRGKKYLRLDCEASRPKLRALYERLGFKHHSDKQVGWYSCSRYEYFLKAGMACPPQPSGGVTAGTSADWP